MQAAFSTVPLPLTKEQKVQQYCERMATLKFDILKIISRLTQLSIPLLQYDFTQLLSNIKGKLNLQYMQLMDKILL